MIVISSNVDIGRRIPQMLGWVKEFLNCNTWGKEPKT